LAGGAGVAVAEYAGSIGEGDTGGGVAESADQPYLILKQITKAGRLGDPPLPGSRNLKFEI